MPSDLMLCRLVFPIPNIDGSYHPLILGWAALFIPRVMDFEKKHFSVWKGIYEV